MRSGDKPCTGLRLTHHGDSTTVLNGPVVDQAALHGVLTRLRVLGLPQRCMRQVHPSTVPPAPTPDPCPRRPTASGPTTRRVPAMTTTADGGLYVATSWAEGDSAAEVWVWSCVR